MSISIEHVPEYLTWAFMFLRCASPVFVAMEELRSASSSRGVSGRVRAHADERTAGGTAFKGHLNEVQRESSLSAIELTVELPTT